MNILVVDGNVHERKAIMVALQQRNHNVKEFDDYDLYTTKRDVEMVVVNCHTVTSKVVALCGRMVQQRKAVVLIARRPMSRKEENRLCKTKLFEFMVCTPSVSMSQIVGLVSITIGNTRSARLGVSNVR